MVPDQMVIGSKSLRDVIRRTIAPLYIAAAPDLRVGGINECANLFHCGC
jgi:hypothetical protein